MRVFSIIILLMLCLTAGCIAESASRFQSVSGDFAKNWLNNFKAEGLQPAQDNASGDLWSWGNAPKGSQIVDGKLATDPYYLRPWFNLTSNWLGDTFVDPSTGYPVYTYVESNTRKTVYVYVDPNTGKTVHSYINPITGTPGYIGVSPSYASIEESNGFVLPPIFDIDSGSLWA